MKWFPEVKIEENKIMIPHIDEEGYRVFEWNDGEGKDEFLERHNRGVCLSSYDYFSVSSKCSAIGSFKIFAFKVHDILGEDFFLMCTNNLSDPDDIKESILIPPNPINLMIFYREYLLPFADISFDHG